MLKIQGRRSKDRETERGIYVRVKAKVEIDMLLLSRPLI